MNHASDANHLYRFNRDDIRDFLASRDKPVMEIELLWHLTGSRELPKNREELFALHFSLYHALYRLKSDTGAQGFYLHLDPMRTRLIHLPDTGRCHHYFPETGFFCGLASENSGLCPPHAKDAEILDKLFFDPLYDFYTNEDNISFGKSGILDKLMNGVIIYALKKGEIQRALDFFGLSRPTIKIITKKYRELAKSYHPDRNCGDDTMMKKLNYAYQVLKEVFIV